MRPKLQSRLDPKRRFAGEEFAYKEPKSGPYTKTSTSPTVRTSRSYQDLKTYYTDPPAELVSQYTNRDDGVLTKRGVYNRFWKDSIRGGQFVGSEYSVDRTWYERSSWTFTQSSVMTYYNEFSQPVLVPQKYWYDGYVRATLSAPPTIDAAVLWDLDQKALAHLAKKTKEAYQKISGMVFLGELRETISMIRKPAIALRRATSNYLKTLKRRASVARNNREMRLAVNQTYLEFTYGVQPLISDVKAGAVAFAEALNRRDGGLRPIRSKRFGFEKEAIVSDNPNVVEPWHGYLLPQLPIHERITTSEKLVVSYWTAQDYSLARWERSSSWATTFGISLDEFVPTLWELLPWSFVADYFTNIGDILDFESTDWSRVLACYCQTKFESTYAVQRRINIEKLKAQVIPNLTGWTDSGWAVAASHREMFTRTPVDIRNQHLDFNFQLIPERARQVFNLASLGLQLAATRRVTTRHF